MTTRRDFSRRQTAALGRSGPRSKTGCRTCKLRRVRCNEHRPICGDCERLHLECVYLPPQKRRGRRGTTEESGHGERLDERTSPISETAQQSEHLNKDGSSLNTSSVSNRMDETYSSLNVGDEDSHLASPPSFVTAALAGTSLYGVQNLTPTNRPSFLADSATGLNQLDSNLGGASSHMHTFVPDAAANADWHNERLSDYQALPDPSFPFTAMAFIGSVDSSNLDPDLTGNLLGDLSGVPANNMNISEPQQLGSTFDPVPSPGGQTGLSPNGRYSFTISPPLLSPAQEESLLAFFQRDIQPPASLVGVDPLGWAKIWRCAIRMARERHDSVLHAIFALTTLLTAASDDIKLGVNRHGQVLFASRLQEAACAAMQVGTSHPEWRRRNRQPLLVSVFLLAWFETAYDEASDSQPAFPLELAEKVIVEGGEWDDTMSHILQWLNMLDAKSSHLGGRNLLSEAALKVARDSRPRQAVARGIDDSETGVLTPTSSSTDHPRTESVDGSEREQAGVKSAEVRMKYLLSSSTQQTLPTRVIRMDVFNILLQPAFEFHMLSQAYFRRVGCHDRHHRSRGTPEDEFEIMKACMGFEEELQELWKRRPGILNINAEQLRQFMSVDFARRLEQLFSVYIATFWGHFIYIHRVAFWNLDHTSIVRKALQETGDMMRRSVGQPMDQHAFDFSIERTSSNSIHPGLMWTCFMFGCEITDPVQEYWAVAQLRALGSLKRAASAPDGELLDFRLDEKGAQNALKASRLLEVLIDRQTKGGHRVDGKYLCQELFGCHFYII